MNNPSYGSNTPNFGHHRFQFVPFFWLSENSMDSDSSSLEIPDSTLSSPLVATAETKQARSKRISLAMAALELMLPSTCRICDRCVEVGEDFCRTCEANLRQSESVMESGCSRCGRPGGLANLAPTSPDDTPGCVNCQAEKLWFDQCIALWTYDGIVRNAVVASKYGGQSALADAMGRRLAARILSTIAPSDPPDWVTFVPSHLWRRVQRGVGGSRVLATSVRQQCDRNWPNLRFVNTLAITRRVQKQAWLGEKERAENVRGAFRLRKTLFGRPLPDRLAGKHVLLVDDVITTGATSSEIARTLKASGARRVTVAAVARAAST